MQALRGEGRLEHSTGDSKSYSSITFNAVLTQFGSLISEIFFSWKTKSLPDYTIERLEDSLLPKFKEHL